MNPKDPLLLDAGHRAADSMGMRYWKSLEEWARTPEFRSRLEREFPLGASVWDDPSGRREFLRIMAASLALAGVTACTRQPEEKIVPYVRMPEEVIPGRPLFFATATLLSGYATGVLVESHMGRPTKVEGNPDHPSSLGSTDALGQAAILSLYDPDRSQTITHRGEIRSWSSFLAELRGALERQRSKGGSGLRILTGSVTSPTLAKQIQGLLALYPSARWHQWEPVGRDNARAGAFLAFGEDVETRYQFERADVVLSLDADFISSGPGSVRYIRDFTSRRKVAGEGANLNRLYAIESAPGLTGALADHRLAVRHEEVEVLARALAAGLGIGGPSGALPAHKAWVEAVVQDLKGHADACLVIAGEWQPAAVHALAHAMNERLGSPGRTLVYTQPVAANPVDQLSSLKDLAGDMEAGSVELLLILDANPVYTSPADVAFAEKMDRVPLRVHLGLYDDETAARCHWHVPEAHPLETWSDARAFDGTITILQPLIAPLYGGKSLHELLAAAMDLPAQSSHDIVKEHWKTRRPGEDFEAFWERSLHDGVVENTALPPKNVKVKPTEWPVSPKKADSPGLALAFRPDPSIFDGRFANNGWLQELPKPLTKLTWDNAVLLSPNTAEGIGLAPWVKGAPQESAGSITEVVELRYLGRVVRAPAWIVPGHPDGSVTVHLGHGRTRAGRVGTGVGFDAYTLRRSDAPWGGVGCELKRTGETYPLACTQHHWDMEGRNLVRSASLTEYSKDPEFAQRLGETPKRELTLYPGHEYLGHAWGMAIDLNSCVGCNACVVACQSENNIPVVGKDQVARGREMHWIRIDRYFAGATSDPEVFQQPIVCMQCENAPCEVVCPVAATTHSDEGLNDQVYNRCVGTRYCSNNCPYKVRRFNFLLYQDFETPSLKLMRNPDVTVRSRGVMEKCTYCVQRINEARIDANNEGRPIRDGEIKTACQQACPGEAIVFGDINDPTSRVSKLKAEPRNYGLLEELNTRPRTTYLASVRNPNPRLNEKPRV